MTHHPRPPFTLSDTTFHFVEREPAAVLAEAREAAGEMDVRLGGGVGVVRQFLDAGLVDVLRVSVALVTLGAGERLRKSADDLLDRFSHEEVPAPAAWCTTCSGAADRCAGPVRLVAVR